MYVDVLFGPGAGTTTALLGAELFRAPSYFSYSLCGCETEALLGSLPDNHAVDDVLANGKAKDAVFCVLCLCRCGCVYETKCKCTDYI